jgi:repressor LexA
MAGPPRRASLTKRQRQIYEYLQDKILNRGYGPTVREIGNHFEIKSPNGVMCHLKALERKGLISREQNMSRAIQLAGNGRSRLAVPLTGVINGSGAVSPPKPGEDHVLFDALFDGADVTCLRVSGSGFSELEISDGDYLILRRQSDFPSGSRVAVVNDRESLVLCTALNGSGQFVALPEATEVVKVRQVLGVVSGIVRRFSGTGLFPVGSGSGT